MDKNTHVYCTNCENFHWIMDCIESSMDYEEDNFNSKDCVNCRCKDCDCGNPEDSMRFEDRPNYESNQCKNKEYVISVDLARPNSKDNCCIVKYNYQEYLKGNIVVEGINYF